eukprot:763385-Hanusia_phi.AAC.5
MLSPPSSIDRSFARALLALLLSKHLIKLPRLANSPLFQKIAWDGTQMVKGAANKSAEEIKKSALYRTAAYRMMEQTTKLKQSEAYQQIQSNHARKNISEELEHYLVHQAMFGDMASTLVVRMKDPESIREDESITLPLFAPPHCYVSCRLCPATPT